MPARNDTSPALLLLAVIACGAALYALADIVTPPAMALFLAIVIDGFARVLERRVTWISKRTALPIAIVLSILLFGAAVFVVADNATTFATQLITYLPKLNALIAKVSVLAHLDVAPTLDELINRLNPSKYLGDVAKGFQNFASNAVFILIYLGFILASRRSFERKLVSLFGGRARRHEAMEAFLRATCDTEYHPVGTCKMGPDSDPMAVVDAQLRVKGVRGLRVVDASIMPTLTSGNTNAPSMVIGEKAADLIRSGV